MRTCGQCGATFIPTGNGYRCPPCRKAYDQEWRAARRAEGKPVSGTRMSREYHREYSAAYYQIPEKRERRNALMREYAKAPHLRPRHEARWQVNRAIAAGTLERQPCESCGAVKTDAHHDDYARPLDVRWFCRSHHVEQHAKAEGKS